MDGDALIRLYDEASPGLYRYAYRLTGCQDLAEECVSETFARYIEVVQRKRAPRDNARAYLYRMAHNWAVDYYRRARPTVALVEDTCTGPEPNPEGDLLARQVQEQLRQALVRLPEGQRMVIELRFMEEWSHSRVAEFLGTTVEATRALQHRALANLRKALGAKRK